MPAIKKQNLILETHGGIIGQSRTISIDRLIYVDPAAYGHLPDKDRYTIARLIGKLTHLKGPETPETIMLFGPGRWGTTTPSLGVPVSFAEISTISVLCEIDIMHEALVPDLSLGTHFFNDLVEMNILYLGIFSANKGNVINHDFLSQAPNRLTSLLPEASVWAHVVRVIDIQDQLRMVLNADTIRQNAAVYIVDEVTGT